MKLAAVDQMAISGSSRLHGLSTPVKLLLGAVLLTGVILSRHLGQVFILLAALLMISVTTGMPTKTLLPVALYPSIFSLPFALGRLGSSPAEAVLIPVKSVSAAMILVMILASTPYPRLLSLAVRILPRLLVDGLFMTYRTFFIIASSLEQLWLNMRLRGAFSWRNWSWSFQAAAQGLALAFVQTITLSERMYQAYTLRGYDGRFVFDNDGDKPTGVEIGMVGLVSLVTTGVIWLG